MHWHWDPVAAAPFLSAIAFQIPAAVAQHNQVNRWKSDLERVRDRVDPAPADSDTDDHAGTGPPARLPIDFIPAELARRYSRDSDVLLAYATLLAVLTGALFILPPRQPAFVFAVITAASAPGTILALSRMRTGVYERFIDRFKVSPAIVAVTLVAAVCLVLSQLTDADTRADAREAPGGPVRGSHVSTPQVTGSQHAEPAACTECFVNTGACWTVEDRALRVTHASHVRPNPR